jgi:hypothetical protein
MPLPENQFADVSGPTFNNDFDLPTDTLGHHGEKASMDERLVLIKIRTYNRHCDLSFHCAAPV